VEALPLLLACLTLFVLRAKIAFPRRSWGDYSFDDDEAAYESSPLLASRYHYLSEDPLPYHVDLPATDARRRRVGLNGVVQIEDSKAFTYKGTRFPLGVVDIQQRGGLPVALRVMSATQYLDEVDGDHRAIGHYVDCCPLLVGVPVYYPEFSVQELGRAYILMRRRRKHVPQPSWGDAFSSDVVQEMLPDDAAASLRRAVSTYQALQPNDLLRLLLREQGLDYSPSLDAGIVFLAPDGPVLGVPSDAKEATKVSKRRKMLQRQIHSDIRPEMLDFAAVPGELWEDAPDPVAAVPRVVSWLASQGWHIPLDHQEDLALKLLLGETLPSRRLSYRKVDVDKRKQTAFWMPGESGDKLGSIGAATVNGQNALHAFKSILFLMDEIGLDRPPKTFIADGYKGRWEGTHLDSQVGLLNVARYASRGLRRISLAVTHGLAPWADWRPRDLLRPFHDYMSGNLPFSRYRDICAYTRGGERHDTAIGACLANDAPAWTIRMQELWSGRSSLLTHALGVLRDCLSPKRLGMYKVLCGTVGDDINTLRAPLDELYRHRRDVAHQIAWQLDRDPQRLSQLFVAMGPDTFAEWFERNDVCVVLQFFPHFPGINVKLNLRLWDTQVIGVKPRLAWSLMRDFDGDTCGFHFPTRQETRFSVDGDYIYRLSTSTRRIARDFLKSVEDDFCAVYEGDALDLSFEGIERKYAVGMAHHYAHFNGLQWLYHTQSPTRIPSPETPPWVLLREYGLAGAMFLFLALQQTAISEKELVARAFTHDVGGLVHALNATLGHPWTSRVSPAPRSRDTHRRSAWSVGRTLEDTLRTRCVRRAK
jgi:hypothetical protein